MLNTQSTRESRGVLSPRGLGRLRRTIVQGLAIGVAYAGFASPATAQAKKEVVYPPMLFDENGVGHPQPMPPSRNFTLYAGEDLAWTGMKMTGSGTVALANDGPCAHGAFTQPTLSCQRASNLVGSGTIYYGAGMVMGTPISDFRKIRAVWPGVATHNGPLGYTAPYTEDVNPPFVHRWGPADGQFGVLFAGVTSTTDGSCQDMSASANGSMPAGRTLLAGSDCPVTWPGGVWKGKYTITDSGWYKAFIADKANFQWQDWRLPASAYDTTQIIGTFATYGTMSDYYREQAARYGGVSPLGSGPPSDRGYPLGIYVRWDAWQFGRPSIRNAMFWQGTIINRSKDVYGAGVDYDSLYWGLLPGYANSQLNAQGVTWYFDMKRNAMLAVGGNISKKCSATYPTRLGGSGGCGNNNSWTEAPSAIQFLKSPLGDVRYKMFSDPTSPYYNPTSPYAGDTIVFNIAKASSFGRGPLWQERSDRSLFGAISATNLNMLDDRTPAQFSTAVGTLLQQFGGEEFDGLVSDNSTKFPHFVPGNVAGYGAWDYNHDGIQDTIHVPGCSSRGCAAAYSDTNGFGLLSTAGNASNTIALGPFKLKAGDTTQVLIAMIAAGDSNTFEGTLNSVLSSFYANFAGANPIAPPVFTNTDVEVTSAYVRDSTSGLQTANVRVRLVEPKPYVDKFVQDQYNKFVIAKNDVANNTNVGDPRYKRLYKYNPGIDTIIKKRISNNYLQLQIFKSCDKGANFTVSTSTTASSCSPATARDVGGASIGFGWRPYQTLTVDTVTGKLSSNAFTDAVQAGRQYLYSFVTRSRGLIDIPLVDSVGCQAIAAGASCTALTLANSQILTGPTNLFKALIIDADTIVSPLFKSGPSTVLVYAPITLPAGTKLATFDTVKVAGKATRAVIPNARSSVKAGKYKLTFANKFTVTTVRDTVAGTSVQTVLAERVVYDSTQAVTVAPLRTYTSHVISSDTFTGAGEMAFNLPAASTGGNPITIPSTRIAGSVGPKVTYIDVIRSPGDTAGIVSAVTANGLGYVLTKDSTGDTKPFYLSATIANSVTAFETSTDFPGFTLGFEGAPANNSTARVDTVAGNTTSAGILLRSPTDTLDPGVYQGNAATYQSATSLRAGVFSISAYDGYGGKYLVKWKGDAFGPQVPFRLASVTDLQPVVLASVAARPTAYTTVVNTADSTTVAKGVSAANTGGRVLIAAKLPFVVTGPDGQTLRLGKFPRNLPGAADSAFRNSIVLGTNGDTTRIAIPVDQWMPGDTLFAIETVSVDSTVAGATVGANQHRVRVFDASGQPITVKHDTVTFSSFRVACTSGGTPARTSCNPIALGTTGFTGYLPMQDGWIEESDFPYPFDINSSYSLTATGTALGAVSAAVKNNQILVVPNPYIVASSYDDIPTSRIATPQVMFTNVPDQGILRIYSVSGQYLQQLTWTAADLINRGSNLAGPGATANGDLPYNLRTREGLELSTGLYLFVLTGTGIHKGFQSRGKFVIIR